MFELFGRKMTWGDAVLLKTAEDYEVEAIITWNKKHFEGRTTIEILTPEEYLRGGEGRKEGWHEEQVDLGSYAGQAVALTLSVIPGPEWEMIGDWAGWGEPRIVDTTALPLVALRLPLRLRSGHGSGQASR